MSKQRKVLFIIKERYVYGQKTKAYGLYNSCDFVARKLEELGIESKVVQVVDNNCIDREVHLFKPTDVFIEALWVVPDKFKILSKLHPKVKWHIRLHSKTPFIATEGIAFDWLNQYMQLRSEGVDIELSANSIEFYKNLKALYHHNVSYTPNLYYPNLSHVSSADIPNVRTDPDEFHIGIFGALRPLKNHVQQAVWAIEFGRLIERPIVVHINVSEHEASSQNGVSTVLTNLRNLFVNRNDSRLYEHPWYPHGDFINLVRQMDLGMQVSFSETFNITAADFVYNSIPIVASSEIPFVNGLCKIETNSSDDAMSAMKLATKFGRYGLNKINKMLLNKWNEKAEKEWSKLFDLKHK